MPSWHPLTQTGPRFGILPSLGRSSRLLGHGQPRPIRWFSRIIWGARIKWAPYYYPKKEPAMTHQEESAVFEAVTAIMIEHSPAAMASACSIIMNCAMQIEREQTLKAESHQRTADRPGYANGFKPKTLRTRVSIRRLKDVAIVMDLHELAPVGGRATSGRHRWRLERFAKMREGLTSRGLSHPGLLPLANLSLRVSRLLPAVSSQPDVAAARWALVRKLLPHPRHELGLWRREVSCERGF